MSEKITVNVPHRHTRMEAKQRIDSGFEQVQQQIGGKGVTVEQAWDGDVMGFVATTMGQKITGNLAVSDDQVTIEVDLPWFLAKLSGTVKEKLAKGTQLLLEKK